MFFFFLTRVDEFSASVQEIHSPPVVSLSFLMRHLSAIYFIFHFFSLGIIKVVFALFSVVYVGSTCLCGFVWDLRVFDFLISINWLFSSIILVLLKEIFLCSKISAPHVYIFSPVECFQSNLPVLTISVRVKPSFVSGLIILHWCLYYFDILMKSLKNTSTKNTKW